VTTDAAQGQIEEYRSGQSEPYRTITDKLSFPAGIVLTKSGWLYVANAGEYYSDEIAILEFQPHSLKPSSREITQGVSAPLGLAYYPPLLP
jgi:hypothetical protein